MAKYGTADIRNVAFVGGPHTGKTSLIEAMLFAAGALPRRGHVHDGTSNVDYDPEERAKKHSLYLKVFHCTHNKHEFNVVDSPGYPDYLGEAIAAMNAAETAAVCLSAADGVTFPVRRIWNEVVANGRGRVLIVNRIDAENVDLGALVQQIQDAFGKACVPVNLPIDPGAKVSGVVDVLAGYEQAPAALKDLSKRYHDQLIETLVTLDDKAMEKYLETGDATLDEVVPFLRRGITDGQFTPILFAAAEKDVGVKHLLDFLTEYTPSPLEGPFFNANDGLDGKGAEKPVDPKVRHDFSARIFKTLADPFVGRVSYVRVLSGQVKVDDLFVNARLGKHEKMQHISRPQGKEVVTTDFAQAGDIVAIPKVESFDTNDTLTAEKAPIRFPPMKMPLPMVALAVTPKKREDDQKVSLSLRKLAAEDPTFTIERDHQTAELIVHGLSALHVDTVLHRLAHRYKVEVETKIPRVPLRETIGAPADGHHRHKKQSGGRGQFGEVYLKVKPNERGKGFEFVDDVVGGAIPRQYIPAVEKGIIDQLQKGVVAGYPVVDVVVSVYDGKYHDVDSDEASFKMAGARAFRDAFEKAHPVLLEPIVELEVAIPSKYMGDITSDMNGRRGRISGMDSIGDTQVIKVHVPLKEIQTYAQDLRSITQGQGSYTFHFSHYDQVPHKVADELIAAHRAGRKEEE